jgi:hypothetical protein
MRTTLSATLFLFAVLSAGAARADMLPTAKGPASATEAAFITSIQGDLMKRFPTAADAEKAGYIRYTNEDETGAISYANLQWQSSDSRHPSQLWYDVNGNLLGADFSALKTDAQRPQLWGINPGRWSEFDGHVHYVVQTPAGTRTYDHWAMNPAFVAAGGNLQHPSAATLVKLGKVKNVAAVATVFEFPTIWDLIVWVKPNPDGAFAYKNPLVHPTKSH